MAAPDRLAFAFEGYACLIVRAWNPGTLSGYVGVPPGHRFHGQSYQELSPHLRYAVGSIADGPTYSRRCHWPICHDEKPGAPPCDLWWIGFDTTLDLSPRRAQARLRSGPHLLGLEQLPAVHAALEQAIAFEDYRDLQWVRERCHHLAQHCARIGRLPPR